MAKSQAENVDSIEFVMKFPASSAIDQNYELKTSLEIPYKDSADELAHRLITSLRLPFYINDGKLQLHDDNHPVKYNNNFFIILELTQNITNFAKEKLQIKQDQIADELVLNAQKQSSGIDNLVKQWEKAYKGVCWANFINYTT